MQADNAGVFQGEKRKIDGRGEMAEWLKAHDSKSCVRDERTVGSNPTLSAIKRAPHSFKMRCSFYKCWLIYI